MENSKEIKIQQINADVLNKFNNLKKHGVIDVLSAVQKDYEDMVVDKLGISKDKVPNLLKIRRKKFLIFFGAYLLLFIDVFWVLSSVMKDSDTYLSMYWVVYYLYFMLGLYMFWFCYFRNPYKQLGKALNVASKKLNVIA